MTITPEEFFKKLEAMERSKKIDILKKIAAFCYKEYNANSDWSSWAFKNFLWSEWQLIFNGQIYLIGNAKVLLNSQTIAHIKVFCGFMSDLRPVVRVTSTIFDLRTGQIKEIAFCDKSNYDNDVFCSNSYKQEEITFIRAFIRDKTDEIVETISNFIKTITC